MSEASSEADRVVASRRSEASELGERLVELIDDPEGFVDVLHEGLSGLGDPGYARMIERVSPGTPAELAVRGPLVRAIERPLRRALEEGSSASALWLAQRLAAAPERGMRLFAVPCLERSLDDDPERSWQLMRRLARRAGDWIEVDALAGPWAQGVLAEPFRWAELEQLLYSQAPMERRLVGATLATIPHRVPARQRQELRGTASDDAFRLVRSLMGDRDAMVQKALAWAIRSWTPVDPEGSADLLRDEVALAEEHADGHRAWVVRAALVGQSPGLAAALRRQLAGIRRDPRAPSTSLASRQAAGFSAIVAQADRALGQQGERFTRSRP